MRSEKLEIIAKAVHNAWWDEKKRQGLAESHKDAIPYEELPEEVKEYDRVTAKAVMEVLESEKWKESCMPVYDDKNFPVAKEIDGYLYDPPSWKVCDVCGGKIYHHENCDGDRCMKWRCKVNNYCPKCTDSPKPGYIPIPYTPEQWKAAGGILTDDTPVWVKPVEQRLGWTKTDLWQWKNENGRYYGLNFDCIIATSAGPLEVEK